MPSRAMPNIRVSYGAIRRAEALLYSVPDMRRQIRERRAEIMTQGMGIRYDRVPVQEGVPYDAAFEAVARLTTDRRLQAMIAEVATVGRILASLDTQVRRAVILRYWKRMTWDQVADATHASASTVRRWCLRTAHLVAIAMGW